MLFQLATKFHQQVKKQPIRIGVLGDVILDIFAEHIFERQSSEDDSTPIYQQKNVTMMPGGAGNLAMNIRSLGAEVHLLTVTGKDQRSEDMKDSLAGSGIHSIIIQDVERPTTIKRRIISTEKDDDEMKLRFTEARESRRPVSARIAEMIEKRLRKMDIDLLIVSDYARGLITREVLDSVRRVTVEKGMKVLVDPHPNENYGLEDLRDFYLLKPNAKETRQVLNLPEDTADDRLTPIIASVCSRYNYQYMLVTKSENGMGLYNHEGFCWSYPTLAEEVECVSGAGDTVMSVLSIALALGIALEEAMRLASIGAAVVVAQSGTSILQMSELIQFAKDQDAIYGALHLVPFEEDQDSTEETSPAEATA